MDKLISRFIRVDKEKMKVPAFRDFYQQRVAGLKSDCLMKVMTMVLSRVPLIEERNEFTVISESDKELVKYKGKTIGEMKLICTDQYEDDFVKNKFTIVYTFTPCT